VKRGNPRIIDDDFIPRVAAQPGHRLIEREIERFTGSQTEDQFGHEKTECSLGIRPPEKASNERKLAEAEQKIA
jgi:hypothetical protein